MYKIQQLRNLKAITGFVIIALSLSFCSSEISRLKANHTVHLSWTPKSSSRLDFIFNTEGLIDKIVKLDSDSTNYVTKSLDACYNHSACLIQDGKFIQSYMVDNTYDHKSVFLSLPTLKSFSAEKSTSNSTTILDQCKESRFMVYHYCNTHWNPPAYLHKNNCTHTIEWHSPLRCNINSTNYEHPCYLYDDAGKLVDLTPWISSSGSSYAVEIGNSSSIKSFNLNVCNEANECGPNVSSCLLDNKLGLVETGYNNLTSIRHDAKTDTVILTSLGQFSEHCEGQRVKTQVHFICKNHIVSKSSPRLVRSSVCENVIEWQTVHACPVSEMRAAATDCKIKYEPLNIEIDIMQLTGKSKLVEVPGLKLDGEEKKMLLGICQGIPKNKTCEGKETSATAACLVNSGGLNATSLSPNNSHIVASIVNSYIRFADDRLYLESRSMNETCTEKHRDLNIAGQLGARIEFYCSPESQNLPTYLGFDDCTHIFEWGSPFMCLETAPLTNQRPTNGTTNTPHVEPKPNVLSKAKKEKKVVTRPVSTTQQPKLQRNSKVNLDDKSKSAKDLHAQTFNDAKSIMHDSEPKEHENGVKSEDKKPTDSHQESNPTSATKDHEVKSADPQLKIQPLPSQPKIGNMYKFFMISLIVISLVSFVAVIFILDRKTRLGIPLSSIRRQARQAFEPAPVPYSRVNNFNDSLDL